MGKLYGTKISHDKWFNKTYELLKTHYNHNYDTDEDDDAHAYSFGNYEENCQDSYNWDYNFYWQHNYESEYVIVGFKVSDKNGPELIENIEQFINTNIFGIVPDLNIKDFEMFSFDFEN